MVVSETQFRIDVFKEINSRPDTRLFRNNVGLGWVGELVNKTPQCVTLKNPRPVKFGLHVGSADLVGWKSVTITPDMVGKRVAVFLSVETKSLKGTKHIEQINWSEQVRRNGGLSGFAKTIPEVLTIIDGII
jgi:hypothetical protein